MLCWNYRFIAHHKIMESYTRKTISTISVFLLMIVRALCSPKIQGMFYNDFVKAFHLTHSTAGLLFATLNASSFLIAPVVNVLRYFATFRVIAAGGIFLTGICLSSVCFATTPSHLFTLFLGSGIGIGAQLAVSFIHIAEVCGENYPMALSISSLGTSAGLILLPPVIQFLLDTYGVQGAYLISGAIFWQALAFVLPLRWGKTLHERCHAEGDSVQVGNILKLVSQFLHPTNNYILSLTLVLSYVVHQFTYFAFSLFLIPFAEEQDFRTDDIPFIASIAGVGALVAKLSSVLIFYLFTKRPVYVHLVFIVTSFVGAVTFTLYLMTKIYFVWLLLSFYNAFLVHLHVSLINGIMSLVVRDGAFPYACAAQLFLYGVGEVTSGALSGVLFETCLCYDNLFIVLGYCSAFGGLLMIVISFLGTPRK